MDAMMVGMVKAEQRIEDKIMENNEEKRKQRQKSIIQDLENSVTF